MVIHLVVNVMFYVNTFFWQQGVSQFLSPLTILEGVVLDYKYHFQVIFGEYTHTHEATDNTMKSQTVSVKFFSLVTGLILKRDCHSFTLLRMPEDALHRIKK